MWNVLTEKNTLNTGKKMEEFEITLYSGEGLPEFVMQLSFVLMELGVKINLKEIHDDFVSFAVKPAEPLDGKDKK